MSWIVINSSNHSLEMNMFHKSRHKNFLCNSLPLTQPLVCDFKLQLKSWGLLLHNVIPPITCVEVRSPCLKTLDFTSLVDRLFFCFQCCNYQMTEAVWFGHVMLLAISRWFLLQAWLYCIPTQTLCGWLQTHSSMQWCVTELSWCLMLCDSLRELSCKCSQSWAFLVWMLNDWLNSRHKVFKR